MSRSMEGWATVSPTLGRTRSAFRGSATTSRRTSGRGNRCSSVRRDDQRLTDRFGSRSERIVRSGTVDPAVRAARRHRSLRLRVLDRRPGRPRRRLPEPARRPGVAFFRSGRGGVALAGRAPATGRWSATTTCGPPAATRVFCSGKGSNIGDLAGRDQRVLRVDDQHGRPQALPLAHDRRQGLHPEGGQPRRAVRQGRRRPALVDRMLEQYPDRRVRLRRGDRRAPAARDHLRHDGHPVRRRAAGVRAGPTSSSASATRSTAARTTT